MLRGYWVFVNHSLTKTRKTVMIRLCFLIGEDMQNRSGRFHLFTHWDVGVFLHWTTAFMITMLSLLSLAADGWQESLGIVLFFCVIYGSVVAHEFGHVRAAQSYGISVRDIVIYPIGGVATLNSRPETAMSSLHVSLAGPLVSILLALLTPLIYAAVGTLSPETLPWFEQAWIGSETVLGWMVMITHFNLIMAAFNLLPVYPLDGGQALHAVVWGLAQMLVMFL